MQLTLITYLAPSLPEELFRRIADRIRNATSLPTHLLFETRISGPLEGDAEPFSSGVADVGFVCAPSFRWLRTRGIVELLPVAVPSDPRAQGRPVYFSNVIVPAASAARSIDDLLHAEWVCNDTHSLSGFFSIRERLGAIAGAQPQFRFSGSHLQSIALIAAGVAQAAAIDSNVLRLELARRPELATKLRIVDAWGPRPMQPTLVRASLDPRVKHAIAAALLSIDRRDLEPFGFQGFAHAEDEAYVNVLTGQGVGSG
ncbi:MAG TPA: PhnD/SsuA/transferrin family substrate-binding protein [Thermoanaerobaculia bacterium]|nr:PhnD/SsuA/transferrin family substrate-binding protein [Thermoanaerobaculia bacterium]